MSFRERFKKERGFWPGRKEEIAYSLWRKVQDGLLTMDEALDRLVGVV